ncbi:MAG: PEP-utilizing enzyme [Patescibacteria group bacterium]
MDPHIFKKFQVRNRAVIRSEIRREAEVLIYPQLTDNLVYFDPIFHYEPGRNTVIYYDHTELAQDPLFAVHYFNRHQEYFLKLMKRLLVLSEEFKKLTAASSIDVKALRDLLVENMALEGIAINQAENKFADEVLSHVAYQARKEVDQLDYIYFDLLMKELARRLPANLVAQADFFKFLEIENGDYPGSEELARRAQGHIYFKGVLYTGKTLAELTQENNIVIEEDDDAVIDQKFLTGTVACPGKASGPARVVIEMQDLVKIQNGDILVTPMTNPNYLSTLNKVAGIITDEGGITCHAAIIARELGKPCIVGTRVATKMISDGDQIELDADNVSIRIVK